MKALALIFLVVGILTFAWGAATFILDWAERRRNTRDTGDDNRQIDILKRGQVCPWPVRE